MFASAFQVYVPSSSAATDSDSLSDSESTPYSRSSSSSSLASPTFSPSSSMPSSSSSSSSSSAAAGPQSCSMERTKLSTRQIRHALPDWMFEELVDENAERRPRRTRRGNRSRRSRQPGSGDMLGSCSEGISPPTSPVAFGGAQLGKSIATLPVDLQRCFSEWRRERRLAVLQHDLYRQQELERVMWSAYFNIAQAHLMAAH